jgi:hypothetical protein
LPNLPVRNLGGTGIVSDLNPFDLPPNALSAGVNVRFENGKITGAPVMRRVSEYDDAFQPGYLFSIPPIANGAESLVTATVSGDSLQMVAGATVTDVTPLAGVTPDTGDYAFTHTFLGNVAYLNRRSSVPLQKRPSDARFTALTAWNSGWRCSSLRSYKDFLVALNVQKTTTEYPTMVKWSDVATFGGPPISWDETSTTNSAGETILNEMREPIIDGLSLRDSFIIYGTNEVWIMDYIGGNFLFRFRKLYDSVGVINQNCVVQVDGIHYVFGQDDLYAHDGASKRSIVHGSNKDYVFQGLIKQLAHLCFVTVDPHLNEIHFVYPSGDRLTGFQNPTTGCNRAAVYNYRRETWTFYDLPNVTSSTVASLSTGESYASVGTVSYDLIGGSYLGDADDKFQFTLFSSRADTTQGLTKGRLYGLDLRAGGRLVKPLDLEAFKPSFIERVGIDIDEQGVPLVSYKVIHALYPQVELTGTTPVQFQLGAANTSAGAPAWGPKISFDPATDTQLDTREAGRYLGYRLYYAGTGDFALSGFDARIVSRGRQ